MNTIAEALRELNKLNESEDRVARLNARDEKEMQLSKAEDKLIKKNLKANAKLSGEDAWLDRLHNYDARQSILSDIENESLKEDTFAGNSSEDIFEDGAYCPECGDKEAKDESLNESISTAFDVTGFRKQILDSFEDEGVKGYNICYSKDGEDIVTIEVWDAPTPVTVISNDYAPNMFNRIYDDFNSFVNDLIYKSEKYIDKNESLSESKFDPRKVDVSNATLVPYPKFFEMQELFALINFENLTYEEIATMTEDEILDHLKSAAKKQFEEDRNKIKPLLPPDDVDLESFDLMPLARAWFGNKHPMISTSVESNLSWINKAKDFVNTSFTFNREDFRSAAKRLKSIAEKVIQRKLDISDIQKRAKMDYDSKGLLSKLFWKGYSDNKKHFNGKKDPGSLYFIGNQYESLNENTFVGVSYENTFEDWYQRLSEEDQIKVDEIADEMKLPNYEDCTWDELVQLHDNFVSRY